MFTDQQARQLCEDLSLARNIPRALRDQARHELYNLAPPAPMLFPSWRDQQLEFRAPPGWRPMNHCITWVYNHLYTAVRCTCYVIDDRGPRLIEQSPHFSRTFLLCLDDHTLRPLMEEEIVLEDLKEPVNPAAPSGFEDMRIFAYRGDLWGIATRCDTNEEAWPEQWLGQITDGFFRGNPLPSPALRRPEKNWMPFSDPGYQCFVYSCDPTVLLGDGGIPSLKASTPRIAADHFRGSSQLVSLDMGWLAVVHTCTIDKSWPKNLIRFVLFDEEMRLAKISDAFRFVDRFEQDYLRGYQYAMGMCFHPDRKRLLVSYSLGDGQSWIGAVDAADVSAQLRSV